MPQFSGVTVLAERESEMEDLDRALAMAMQEEYDNEVANSYDDSQPQSAYPVNMSQDTRHSGRRPKSIVDPAWELIDPNPDIRTLFLEFNQMYFWGKLAMVEVRWSPRMTLCAGLCCYEGRGGLCSVRLSKPLLQLRPRKDLVETLLHEMIHALLFVTDNNKDHDGHGPEFCKHMHRINAETGTNISIYHNFHDEVRELRKHWWRCEGPCRMKPPYFGYVRRSMNRAPGPRDPWWPQHQSTCGGTYIKVKEPENYGVKKKKEKAQKNESTRDIKSFLSQKEPSQIASGKIGLQGATSSKNEASGHRLGGSLMTEIQNTRGIPASSRLLTQSHTNISRSSAISSVKPQGENSMQASVPDKWTSLISSKRKTKVLKSSKNNQNVIDLLTSMKQRGGKSVNAGAAAFQATMPVTKFQSKRVLHFVDTDDEADCSTFVGENAFEGERLSLHKSTLPNCDETSNAVKTESAKPNDALGKRYFDDDKFRLKNLSLDSGKKCTSDQDCLVNSRSSKKVKRLPSFSDDDAHCSVTKVANERSFTATQSNKRFKENNDDDDLPVFDLFTKKSSSVGPQSVLADAKCDPPPALKSDCDSLQKQLPVERAECPICSEQIALSSINSHIDECLSLKAIRDSSFD